MGMGWLGGHLRPALMSGFGGGLVRMLVGGLGRPLLLVFMGMRMVGMGFHRCLQKGEDRLRRASRPIGEASAHQPARRPPRSTFKRSC
jgi:predicted lipid-binding transport protein (Tim44 family)